MIDTETNCGVNKILREKKSTYDEDTTKNERRRFNAIGSMQISGSGTETAQLYGE
jgi:hypothetical protein